MSDLAIHDESEFLFGTAPRPVRCGNDLEVGTGTVIPEINFTLSSVDINRETWTEVRKQYESMIDSVMKRAVALDVPSLLVEFETLPPMTSNPAWGLEITRILSERLADYHARYGMKTALRLTPNDTREFERPPRMRSGRHWENMVALFAAAGGAGVDLLAIESTGGKEICDEALVEADLGKILFSLGVLGATDMEFLWKHLVSACRSQDIVASGDTACGFANTAMVLADRGMIPKVLAAVVRVASVPRSLVGYRCGAAGPSKDCAYEGPYMKAIAGVPISMEGRTAACAHLSPVGNVSQAVCDCWSNESVQNVQMLSGRAPQMCLEQLVYDCRLLNRASRTKKEALMLRDWLSDSDTGQDPQAWVLKPEVVLRICSKIVQENEPYGQTLAATRAAIDELKAARNSGDLKISNRELPWLGRMEQQLEELPEEAAQLTEKMLGDPLVTQRFLPGEYEIG